MVAEEDFKFSIGQVEVEESVFTFDVRMLILQNSLLLKLWWEWEIRNNKKE